MNTRFEILKRYHEEDPDDSFIRYALALEYIAMNQSENAFSYLEKLINDDPDYLPAYYMAGKTAEELGKNILALKWYSEGIIKAEEQKKELRDSLNTIVNNKNDTSPESFKLINQLTQEITTAEHTLNELNAAKDLLE